MAHYLARLKWQRAPSEKFTDGRYSRVHSWRFDGGAEIEASSSPDIVPIPFSAADLVDPEEAFVAALASCHMLFFLSRAARRGFVVESYEDRAEGVMERNAEGRTAITRVTLSPNVVYAGTPPDSAREAQLHEEAHELCFIANSVKTRVQIRPDREPRRDVSSD